MELKLYGEEKFSREEQPASENGEDAAAKRAKLKAIIADKKSRWKSVSPRPSSSPSGRQLVDDPHPQPLRDLGPVAFGLSQEQDEPHRAAPSSAPRA